MASDLINPNGVVGVLADMKDGKSGVIPAIALRGAGGGEAQLGGKQETLTLASNAAAPGNQPPVTAYGGDYVVRAFATNWNSATAKLQFLDADGATWSDLTKADGTALTPFSANGTISAGFGSAAQLRLSVTGTPTGLYVTASRIP